MSPSERTPSAPVALQFLERWSPRAFSQEPVSREELSSLFEAARWAPSCFNEQPWLFVYGADGEDRARIEPLLVEGNRAWARKAPVLGVVFARKNFARNGAPNRWASFDSGAASMSLALQALDLGLSTHFMGGFDEAAAHEALNVPRDEFEAMAAFAIGRRGDPGELEQSMRERERPSDRKDRSEVAVEGRYRT